MIVLKDTTASEIVQFLEQCESKLKQLSLCKYIICGIVIGYGKNITTVVGTNTQIDDFTEGMNTVTYEARLLKALFLRLT